MNVFEFASSSPWLSFFLAYLLVHACIEYPLKIVNRWIRHRNIVAAGWPPAHLDADGDWKPKDDKTDVEVGNGMDKDKISKAKS